MASKRTALWVYLKRTGILQKDLARSLGVSQPTLNQWVHGAETSFANLRKIHRLTRIPYAELVGERPKKKAP